MNNKKYLYVIIIFLIPLLAFIATIVFLILKLINILDWAWWIIILLFAFGLYQISLGIILLTLIIRVLKHKGNIKKQLKIIKACSILSLNRLAMWQTTRWDE